MLLETNSKQLQQPEFETLSDHDQSQGEGTGCQSHRGASMSLFVEEFLFQIYQILTLEY